MKRNMAVVNQQCDIGPCFSVTSFSVYIYMYTDGYDIIYQEVIVHIQYASLDISIVCDSHKCLQSSTTFCLQTN